MVTVMNNLHPDTGSFSREYPFAPNFHTTAAGRIHYLDEGQGRPVLFVHGNPSWSFLWRRAIKQLSTRYRCIAPDHLGCGRSDKPGLTEMKLNDHIDRLESLILTLDLQDIHLVVHDWGGAIGFGAAGRHPDRFRSLTVTNTAAFWLPSLPWRINCCRWPVFGELALQGANGFARAALTMAVNHRERITAEIASGFLAPYDNWHNRAATLAFVRDIPMAPAHPSWNALQRVEAGLPGLAHLPMTIFWGMKDFCFHEEFLEEWIRRFPESYRWRFLDAGHYLLEDAHERILPLMERFLRGIDQPEGNTV